MIRNNCFVFLLIITTDSFANSLPESAIMKHTCKSSIICVIRYSLFVQSNHNIIEKHVYLFSYIMSNSFAIIKLFYVLQIPNVCHLTLRHSELNQTVFYEITTTIIHFCFRPLLGIKTQISFTVLWLFISKSRLAYFFRFQYSGAK